jgi:plastocyanin
VRPFTTRLAAALAAAALASVAFAACGDDESDQSLTFTLGGEGKAATFEAPASAEAGLAEITLRNEGGKAGDLQLIRVEGDRSPEEVIEGLGKAMKGQAFPEWFFAAGGTGPVEAGQSETVTQVLEPGTYYAFDTEGGAPPKPKDAVSLEVSGESSDEEIEADATIEAVDYGFESEGLTAGSGQVAFQNTGAQPHHVVYMPLKGDATAADVESFFETEKGKPPFDEEKSQNTAVIEGGETQLVDLELEKGRYVLLCFITDRKGGPPHVAKGMIDEVEVE